jgi:A/G-specific adenine glycosylase
LSSVNQASNSTHSVLSPFVRSAAFQHARTADGKAANPGRWARDLEDRKHAEAVRAALLRWYRKHARPLPWRGAKDPYAIWISEVMLQQTQVATVIPYYERFLRAFPDCESLAKAPFGAVAKLWSGLGYYRRARLLHLGARKVWKDFGGRFPATYEEARNIPGVGHYTASAVLSIAYDQSLPVLDGNVARILARLDARRGNIGQLKFRRAVERRLNCLISIRKPGSFNQALMELGQTICLPRGPQCGACPVRRWCLAHKLGRPQDFPVPRPRRATEHRHMAAAIISEDRKIALVRGLDDGLLADLWNFPSAFGTTGEEAAEKLAAKLALLFGSPVQLRGPVGSVRHTITFRSIQVGLYAADFQRGSPKNTFHLLPISMVQQAAASRLAIKIASALEATPELFCRQSLHSRRQSQSQGRYGKAGAVNETHPLPRSAVRRPEAK